MGSLTKALIGKEDCDVSESGVYETFSRLNSVGSTITLTSFPDVWKSATDMVNAKYYSPHTATGATLTAAVGQTVNNNCKDIYIEGGEWVISTDYDWSTYTTTRWIFAAGAYLTVGAGCTVTFPSPSSIVASPNQQIFSGAGTVAFSVGGTRYPEWWGIDGTADEVEIQAALDSYAGGTVKLQAKTYTLSAGIAINQADQTLMCDTHRGAPLTTAADIDAITVTARCRLENLYIVSTHATPTKSGILIDTCVRGYFENVRSDSFYYGFNLAASASGIMHCGFIHCAALYNTYSVHFATGNTVNENNWIDCDFNGAIENHIFIENTTSNNNKFIGCSFQQWGYPAVVGKWAIKDYGVANMYDGGRFESTTAQSNGIYLSGSNLNLQHPPRITNSYWSGMAGARLAVASGHVSITDGRTKGHIIGAYKTATNVNGNSLLGQTVLNIASTAVFHENETIVIGRGTAAEEFGEVLTVQDGVSVTLAANLIYDHLAVDNEEVEVVGLFSGLNTYPSRTSGYAYVYLYVYGILVGKFDSLGDLDLTGELKRGGTQVVGAQQTGVSAMTNVTAPANWDADTVTTAQLADIVGTLIVKLRTHGLIAD